MSVRAVYFAKCYNFGKETINKFGCFKKKSYLCTNILTPLPVEQRAQGECFFTQND